MVKFIYNDWLLIGELDSEGIMTRQYFYSDDANGDAGVGKLFGFTDYIGGIEGIIAPESKTYFVISDNVGTLIKVIDSQGTTMNKYAYSPFGELLVEQEQIALNIGFNTKYEDESGLTYYNNRYYSHSLGHFISQDPIFEQGDINFYSFTVNDPLNHWDILGEVCQEVLDATSQAKIANDNVESTDRERTAILMTLTTLKTKFPSIQESARLSEKVVIVVCAMDRHVSSQCLTAIDRNIQAQKKLQEALKAIENAQKLFDMANLAYQNSLISQNEKQEALISAIESCLSI